MSAVTDPTQARFGKGLTNMPFHFSPSLHETFVYNLSPTFPAFEVVFFMNKYKYSFVCFCIILQPSERFVTN
jgi:hypothetical protein